MLFHLCLLNLVKRVQCSFHTTAVHTCHVSPKLPPPLRLFTFLRIYLLWRNRLSELKEKSHLRKMHWACLKMTWLFRVCFYDNGHVPYIHVKKKRNVLKRIPRLFKKCMTNSTSKIFLFKFTQILFLVWIQEILIVLWFLLSC